MAKWPKISSLPIEILIRNPSKDHEDDMITVRLCKERQVSISTWDGYNSVYLNAEEWPRIVEAVEEMFRTQGEFNE